MIAQRPSSDNYFSRPSGFRRVVGYLTFTLALSPAVGCRSDTGAGPGPGADPPAVERAGSPGFDARLRDARVDERARDPDVLGRAGAVTLDVAGFRVAVDEARVLEQWRRGAPPPLQALANPRLRRRLMTQALETRVVRREARRRGLAPDPTRFGEMLRLAAAGHRLETPPTPEVIAAARALPDVDRALVERFGAPAERVRRVGQDVIEAELLADALLAEVPEATLAEAWRKANTRVVLDLVRVPRVPTSGEIDRAVAERQPAITAYYRAHPRLFRSPERAFVRRLLVPVAADASPAERAAARARAEALRAEAVAAGPEGFEALVRREAPPREARSGGRMTVSRDQLPAAYAVDPATLKQGPGPLSPVEATAEGWHIWRLEARAPAVERPLNDPRVQREIAAELLREEDALPAARRTAGRVRALLGQDPDGPALKALVEEARLQRHTTEPFDAAGPPVVPVIGVAPELFEAAFALTAEAPLTSVLRVRQHYVVGRLVSREAPEPDGWPAARERFTAEWKARQRPRVIDEWLTRRLDGRPMWIDTPKLQGLTLGELGVEVEAPGSAPPDSAPPDSAPGDPPSDGGVGD